MIGKMRCKRQCLPHTSLPWSQKGENETEVLIHPRRPRSIIAAIVYTVFRG